MHSDPAAAFSGNEMGAGVDRARGTVGVVLRDTLGAEQPVRQRLHPDQPFGITFIVGGTNIRACVSLPGASKPINFSLPWQQLHDDLKPVLDAQRIDFGVAHDLVLSAFVKSFFDELKEQHCDPTMGPPPFDKLAALNFSVAGVVRGEGIDATVSTTNTGLHFTNEELAKRMISAMQTELQQRSWPAFPVGNVAILNDAAAGCKGEVLRGGLKECTHGLFVILGTGVGSMGWSNNNFDFRFDELGHRIVKESLPEGTQRPTTVVNLFRFMPEDEYQAQVASDGSFIPFKGHGRRYAENVLAGPWLAVRFLKKELAEDEALMSVLAAKIAPQFNKTRDEVIDNLQDLMELSSKVLTRWAVNSNSRLVKAVNDFILNFDAWRFAFSCPCTGSFEAAPTPERRLANLGFKTWKTYWEDVGHFLAVAYAEMKEQGVAPEKIILGGGIGEAYHKFPEPLKMAALLEIQDHSGLPEGLIQFSAISAEERESAITQSAVDRAAEELASKRRLNVTEFH
jgi:hypothetical protein